MQVLESQWLRDHFATVPDEELFPLLDVGSSTLEYRTRTQPYVEANIFAPLRLRGGRVLHADLKSGPGIDLVGDLLDPAFIEPLSRQGFRSATLFNVLHHVRDRHAVAAAIAALVPSNGYLFVSGPHRFPRHFDPIDSMFRPSLDEAAALFPDTEVVDGAILDSGNWRQWKKAERGNRSLPRALVRLTVPFYRPAKWWELARQVPYFIKHIEAYALVLRKR